MYSPTTKFERAVLATLAVALSLATLSAATLVPMHAEQATVSAKARPSVETVLVRYEPLERATRVN